MINNLPISPNKRFKYSITFESWDEDSLEMGQTDVRGNIEQDELDAIGDILYEANTTYGIYMPFAFGRWESTYPDEDTDYFEKGIRKFYFLEITNEDGTQISNEENDFITFLAIHNLTILTGSPGSERIRGVLASSIKIESISSTIQ